MAHGTRRNRLRTGLTSALLSGLLVSTASFGTELGAVPLLRSMASRYVFVQDYTSVFLLQERVNGSLLPLETAELKFKVPLKVYMKWLEGPGRGREVLYVDGQNDGRVLVREGGLFGLVTFRLDPKGALAMRNRRYPVTEIGMGFLIEQVIGRLEGALARRALDIRDTGPDTVAGRLARKIAMWFPSEGNRGAEHVLLWVDEELGLPIHVQTFDSRGELLESYSYTQLRVNVGLDDAVFDPHNPAYRF